MAQPLITLNNVTAGYDQNDAILHDVSLEVNCNDFILITGPNGGGKTTLLKVILRLLKPSQGRVNYIGKWQTGYLPQKTSIDARFPVTVAEVVASGMTAKDEKRVSEILNLIGMQDFRNQAIGALSGGQLQRVLLGRAIISHPNLLVLDEPLSYVDKHFEEKMYDIIRDYACDSTVIVVTHDQSTLGSMATRHLKVDHGVDECTHVHHEMIVTCVD